MLAVFGRTHAGRVREENQDRMLCADLATGSPALHASEGRPGSASVGPVRIALSGPGALLLVADGMGGRAGGARASTLAADVVLRAMAGADGAGEGPEAFAARLGAALEEANREIHAEAEADARLRGMGTTATLAGIRADRVHVAQVGDSRAYLVRNGTARRLTRDQSLVQEMIDSGVLSEDEARSVARNRILQALGPAPSVRPALGSHELRPGDRLLVCSDGLPRVVSDDEIAKVVSGAPDERAACERLVALANERGGPDNVTVLVAGVEAS
ncbi:MAG TPA: protein phosphatase 2C domain-containing protein [Longimicrobiales bacterium]|nr:protein phosphatase 2C domain-containing protein [Longimicrobiales bacterium]